MKIIQALFIVFFLFLSVGRGWAITLNYSQSSCPVGTYLFWSDLQLQISSSLVTCQQAYDGIINSMADSGLFADNVPVSTFINDMSALGCTMGVNCTGAETYVTNIVLELCCPNQGSTAETSEVPHVGGNSRARYQQVDSFQTQVGGVASGQESEAADGQCVSWAGSTVTPTPEDGYVLAGGYLRVDASIGLQNSEQLADMTITCLRRNIYTKSGTSGDISSPFGAGGSGGGGSGTSIDYAQMKGAFKGALDDANALGYFKSSASGGGTGASAAEISSVLNPLPGGGFSPPSAPGSSDFMLGSGDVSGVKNNLTSSWSSSFASFTTTAKQTALGGLINTFFMGVLRWLLYLLHLLLMEGIILDSILLIGIF